MTIDRRTFIATISATLAASGIPGAARAAQVRKAGLQLYSIREIFQKDPVATLQAVARIGYREVEYGGGGYDKMDHALLRKTMDKAQLTAPSLHVPYEWMLGDFASVVKMAKTLGSQTLVVPWLGEEQRTEAGFGAAIENINRFGKQARDAGLGLAYHNHDFEFTTRFGGTSLYDRLLAGADPALVQMELDLYWAVHAGEDAAKLIGRLGNRLYAFHVKDMRADKSMTAVGTGTIDFASLFKLPGAAGVKHYYVENDEAPAPYLPDITTSFKNLSALRF
jgi:sugar phosphate isomerase/epimerase